MQGPVDLISKKQLLAASKGLKITFLISAWIAGFTNPAP